MPRAFPSGSASKKPTSQCRKCKRCRFNPWVRKIPWEESGNPLQYSYPENFTDRGTWRVTVHGVLKSRTRLRAHACMRKCQRVKTFLARESDYLALGKAKGSLSKFKFAFVCVCMWEKQGSCKVVQETLMFSTLNSKEYTLYLTTNTTRFYLPEEGKVIYFYSTLLN